MTTTTAGVISDIRTFVGAEFYPDGDPHELADDLDLMNTGIVDSLGLLKIIAWLENTYDFAVNDADLDPANFANLDTIARFVADRTGALQ